MKVSYNKYNQFIISAMKGITKVCLCLSMTDELQKLFPITCPKFAVLAGKLLYCNILVALKLFCEIFHS